MSTSSPDWPITNTEHGMLLVAFGEFLQQHGLLERLRQVPVPQKTHDFDPQDKLIEFLAGIMSGIEHLQDLNYAPGRYPAPRRRPCPGRGAVQRRHQLHRHRERGVLVSPGRAVLEVQRRHVHEPVNTIPFRRGPRWDRGRELEGRLK